MSKTQTMSKTLLQSDNGEASIEEKGLDSLWVIHGKAYDLSEWSCDHPGGAFMIDVSKGTDCSVLFESYHATTAKPVHKMLSRWYVRDLASPNPDYEWNSTPVFDDLKAVVASYQARHGIKMTKPVLVWYLMWLVVHVTTLYRWTTGSNDWSNTLLFGVSLWFGPVDVLHCGTHFALTSPELSWNVGCLFGWLFHIPSAWIRQHVLGHHLHTNAFEKDPDLSHFHRIGRVHGLGWRVSPEAETHPMYRFWFMILFPVMCLTSIAPMLFESMDLLTTSIYPGSPKPTTWVPGERKQTFMVWGAVVMLLLTRALLFGFTHMIMPFFVLGCTYYTFSQVSHVNPKSFEQPSSREWAVSQIYACQGDYHSGSMLWSFISIGLNAQTVHHLFPTVHPVHYPALVMAFKPVFAKHNLPVGPYKQTFLSSVWAHLSHVYSMNPLWGKHVVKIA